MSHRAPDLERLIRSSLGQAGDVPPFGRVWRAALERSRRRRARRRLLLAAVPLSAAVLLAVVLVPAPDPGEPAPELAELAHSLSEVETPLDFLLEPPGGAVLGVDSTAVALPLPSPLPIPDSEEIL